MVQAVSWEKKNKEKTMQFGKIKSVLAIAALSVLLAPVATAALIGHTGIFAPTGTNPTTGQAWAVGDTYHVIFTTAGEIQATSSDIATYNTFVNDQAALSTLPGVSNTLWNAVGSTTAVDARDNAPVTAPVYRLDDVFVANGASGFGEYNFYEGDGLPNGLNVDQHGEGSSTDIVWTGSDEFGTDWGSARALGEGGGSNSWIRAGRVDDSSTAIGEYLDWESRDRRVEDHSMLAMSEQITVVPEPATALLVLLFGGCVGLAHLRRRK